MKKKGLYGPFALRFSDQYHYYLSEYNAKGVKERSQSTMIQGYVVPRQN